MTVPRVVISGVSRGIGRAAALHFAERGATLALLGRRGELHADTVAACRALGITVHDHDCDVSDADQVAAAAAAVVRQMGAPDAVINNAAQLEHGPRVHEIDIAVWDRIIATNLRGPFLLSRALLPPMLAAGRGRLLHVASVSGTIGCPQMAHYGASKWGLLGLHAALTEELRGSGVASIAILPGSVDTAMLEKTPFAPDMPASDVAEVMGYYALDAPASVHGARVEIYG